VHKTLKITKKSRKKSIKKFGGEIAISLIFHHIFYKKNHKITNFLLFKNIVPKIRTIQTFPTLIAHI
jgi:hypothetical protein